jgi:hypothetical protein
MNPRLAQAQRAVLPLSGDERAIARSVLYASLFDYPLTLAQLRQSLIESAMTPTEILATMARSAALQAVVAHRDGFFLPAGHDELVNERRRREARSRAFLESHRTLLGLICALPYVRMVALSGSVAHLNLEGSGDLDLFIVTRGRRVWCVTVAVIVLAKLLRRRRTLCANYVLSDTQLRMDQKDLFTASQIIHLKPLVGFEVYGRLVALNPFVAQLYPNFHRAFAMTAGITLRTLPRSVRALLEWGLTIPSALAEAVCRTAYRGYLRRRARSWQSPEQVRLELDCVKLHTHSHRRSILERFDEASNGISR